MRILVLASTGESLTGGGTYQANVLRELAKRHVVKIYESEADLQEDWDIAHCLNLKNLSLSLARKLRCPLVVDSHDYYWVRYFHFFCPDFPVRFLLQRYRKLKYSQLFNFINGIILHGKYVYDLYDHPNKYLNFYYGLDYSEIESTPWGERENLILFVGGDYFRKGIHRLLRALPLVLKKVPDARLMVIGNDYWYVKLFARILALGLPVEFVYGMPRAELYKTYGKARVFVMPSEIEAIPLVSTEATMAGIPPILSDAGGNPEIVLDGETGFIVPLDDNILLAERIVQCLTEQELSERLVRQGKEFLSRFTAESMIDRLDEIYQDVIEKTG
ncbi:MAG: glycosyltransferase family 4 protein [Geobacteraceae bacterium]|nr:glycosyltransferase family 4 protein [Geobacteraceae bacterium]